MSDIVTVRIDRQTREKARRYGINVSEVAREALKQEIARREKEELLQTLREMKVILRKIPAAEIVRAVRESRDER